jgi:serine/threonine protein kinase/ligand-binding sensor domain-containing protein
MQQHIGKWFGSYQIIEQIGQGGMATVFKAYQPSMDRYVAVKILPSHFTEDESFLGRFTQEARTLARLEHPHILPVHDYGEQEGTTFLVMRYVKAGTLKDLIAREGPMELERAARILGQVGDALDYAHSQGVVHRDIKPSNVLIDQHGNTFLTDFGIAKLVAETAQFTASGAIIGTPAYMSPEQGMGKPADYRCDIYSLGVMLYELVTGQVPFEAETPLAVLLKHVNDPLPLPRQIKPDLPTAVERVILKAMAKDPGNRFQSAQEMIDALAEAVAPKPTEIVSPPLPAGAEATTLARSISTPPTPTADTTPPLQAVPTTPSAPSADTMPPRLEAMAPARTRKRWLFLAGGALLLAVLLFVGVFVVPNLLNGESTPAPLGQTQATPATVSQAQATATESGQPTAVASPGGPEPAQVSPGWSTWTNGNFVYTLAEQGNTLWAGGDGGLVGWNLTDGSPTKLGITHGLASIHINDLLVDDQGVLWIATDGGISRYDGETWITYDEADGLDSSQVEALFQDDTGGLWAGSRGGERGLNYYDGSGWGPPPIPTLPVEYPAVRALDAGEDVELVVGLEDQGMALFDGEAWTTVPTATGGLAINEVTDVLLTDESMWVSFDQGVVRFDREMAWEEVISEEYIYAIHESADGKLWFGGEWHALRYDPANDDWEEFETSNGPIPAGPVTDIVEDEDGLWFGTHGGGLAFYDGSDWETWALEEELGGNVIEAIQQDGDGAVWFAHPGTGLSRYEPEGDVWRVFGETEGASDWPGVPAVDSDGNLWIGEFGELLWYDGRSWQRFTAPELTDVEIWAIEIGPNDVQWLVTDHGLMRHDPASEEWTTFTGADHPIMEDIWSILATSDGTVWAGGEEGLVRYDGSSWGAPEALGDAPYFVDDLAEAPDGSLWVAADGELGHLADGQWSYSAWDSAGWLESVAIGPDGSVWAGYEGLGRYEPASGDWEMFTPADGLGHRIVRAIHVTPEGVVWIGTEGGVSRYVPPD